MEKLLIATKNKGKFEEIKDALKGLPFEFVALAQIGEFGDVAEEGKTFKDNVVTKAKFYAEKTLFWTVADDSGLEIDALEGEPGVKSRRWPGYEATDDELVSFCLEKMKAVPPARRGARFVCVGALAIPRDGVYTAQGLVKGAIADEPRGRPLPGMAFDPIFYYPLYKKTFAEVSPELKQLVSHRAQAFKKLKRKIQTILENEKL